MFRILFFVLLAIPVIELWLLIEVGSVIGGFSSVLLVIATAVMGGIMARRQGLDTYMRMRRRQANGEPILAEMADTLALLFAGFLLLFPGLITDGIGFLLLLRPFRSYLARILVPAFFRASHRNQQQGNFHFSQSNQDRSSSKIEKVIDVDTTKS